jgi:hypothetical protein
MMGYANGFSDCNVDSNECTARPCQNRAQCYESTNSDVDTGEFQCSCNWPNSGLDCNTDVVTRPPRDSHSSQTCEQWFFDKTFTTDVTEKCCEESSGGCTKGYPDTCDADCAAVWTPFWKKCSGYMTDNFPASGSGLGSEYTKFADQCRETQYGSNYRCTTSFFNSGMQAMSRACGASRGGFPSSCSANCANTFLELYEACRPVASDRGANIGQMDNFFLQCQGTLSGHTYSGARFLPAGSPAASTTPSRNPPSPYTRPPYTPPPPPYTPPPPPHTTPPYTPSPTPTPYRCAHFGLHTQEYTKRRILIVVACGISYTPPTTTPTPVHTPYR